MPTARAEVRPNRSTSSRAAAPQSSRRACSMLRYRRATPRWTSDEPANTTTRQFRGSQPVCCRRRSTARTPRVTSSSSEMRRDRMPVWRTNLREERVPKPIVVQDPRRLVRGDGGDSDGFRKPGQRPGVPRGAGDGGFQNLWHLKFLRPVRRTPNNRAVCAAEKNCRLVLVGRPVRIVGGRGAEIMSEKKGQTIASLLGSNASAQRNRLSQ